MKRMQGVWPRNIKLVIRDDLPKNVNKRSQTTRNIASSMVCRQLEYPAVGLLTVSVDFTSNELPEIKKNISQGFQQTQSFVNSWITGVKKRFDGDGEEHDDIVSGQGTGGQRQNFGSSTADQLRGIRKNAEVNRNRRSMDTERYDADAPALSENFGELEIHDNGMPSVRT
jgi:hypothetical protein